MSQYCIWIARPAARGSKDVARKVSCYRTLTKARRVYRKLVCALDVSYQYLLCKGDRPCSSQNRVAVKTRGCSRAAGAYSRYWAAQGLSR